MVFNHRKLVLSGVLFITISLTTLIVAEKLDAKTTAGNQYQATCLVSYLKDGSHQVVAQPQLIIADGVEGAVMVGGEVPVELGEIRFLPVGEEIKIQVFDAGGNKARASIRFSKSESEPKGESEILIREKSVRTIKTITLGDVVVLTRDDGAKAEVTITSISADSE